MNSKETASPWVASSTFSTASETPNSSKRTSKREPLPKALTLPPVVMRHSPLPVFLARAATSAAASVNSLTLTSASLVFPKIDPRIVAWLVRISVIEAEGSFFLPLSPLPPSPPCSGVAAADPLAPCGLTLMSIVVNFCEKVP